MKWILSIISCVILMGTLYAAEPTETEATETARVGIEKLQLASAAAIDEPALSPEEQFIQSFLKKA
jgi:hypothetical protein